MKLLKRTGLYQASNVTFNPETLDAYSYKWWRFVGVVEGVLVVSNYRYSVTTAKHQRKVRDLMSTLGIKAGLILPLPRGVRHDQTLEQMIEEAETVLCDAYLEFQVRKQEQYARRKAKLREAMEARAQATVSRFASAESLVGGALGKLAGAF